MSLYDLSNDYAEELATNVGGTVYLVSEPQPMNSHEE